MRTVTAVKTFYWQIIKLICIPLNFITYRYIPLHETHQMWVNSSEVEFVKDHMLIKFIHAYLLMLKWKTLYRMLKDQTTQTGVHLNAMETRKCAPAILEHRLLKVELFIIDCVIKVSYIDKFHIIVTHTIAQRCTKKGNACKELCQLIKLPT